MFDTNTIATQNQLIQNQILQNLNGVAVFEEENKERKGGGSGGVYNRVIQNGKNMIQKGGVNFSVVRGKLPEAIKINSITKTIIFLLRFNLVHLSLKSTSFNKNKNILFLFFIVIFGVACSPKLKLSKVNKQLYPISKTMPADSEMLAFYKPYKQKLDSVMNDIVAVSDIKIEKNKPEGALNNLFADAMYQSAKAANIDFDIAFTNYGGLRLPLPQGNIYRYKIFELMPFENYFVTVQFTGDNTQKFFDYMASDGGEPISGASYTISNGKAVDIKVNNKAFDSTKTYTVLTSDYIANGGDKGAVFYLGTNRKDINLLMRTAILQYLEKEKIAGRNLNPKIDGRIKVK
ncbi:MAG: coproporphyrinogen III oxidase [Sphingobacteriales bacterium]|nr:MAG: coproporphyrinogen III oxidase [Sphingobacteriales bacterium]